MAGHVHVSGRPDHHPPSGQGHCRHDRNCRRPDRDDHAVQHKLEVVEQLAELAGKAGLTLIELALAFVINHPGVTSAIIGPRTMEQLESQLPAADVALTADVLDRIDELVAPA